jgi:hypothetical protein
VVDIGRDERHIERERMCRNGGIEILNPRSTAFQGRFDAAEHLADGIGPLGSWRAPSRAGPPTSATDQGCARWSA